MIRDLLKDVPIGVHDDTKKALLALADWIISEILPRGDISYAKLPIVDPNVEALVAETRVHNKYLDEKLMQRDEGKRLAAQIAAEALEVVIHFART